MAYPTVSAPYGLKPVNSLDGKPYAGAIRQIPVAAGFATAIFNGDTVQMGFTLSDEQMFDGTINTQEIIIHAIVLDLYPGPTLP